MFFQISQQIKMNGIPEKKLWRSNVKHGSKHVTSADPIRENRPFQVSVFLQLRVRTASIPSLPLWRAFIVSQILNMFNSKP
jgi:hypothetical protein